MFNRNRHNVAAHPNVPQQTSGQIQYDQNGMPYTTDIYGRVTPLDPNQYPPINVNQPQQQIYIDVHGRAVDMYGRLLPQQQNSGYVTNQGFQRDGFQQDPRLQQTHMRGGGTAITTPHRFGQSQIINQDQGLGYRDGSSTPFPLPVERNPQVSRNNQPVAEQPTETPKFRENLTMMSVLNSSARLDKSRIISPDDPKISTIFLGEDVNGSLSMESAILESRVRKAENVVLGIKSVFYTEMCLVPSIYFGSKNYNKEIHTILTADNAGIMALELRKLAERASSSENTDRVLVLLVNELDELLTDAVNDFLRNEMRFTPLFGYGLDSFATDIDGLVVSVKANLEDLYVSLFLSFLSDLKNKFECTSESNDNVNGLLSEVPVEATIINQKYLITVVELIASEIIDSEILDDPIVIDNSDTGVKIKELIKYCDNHALVKSFGYQYHYLVTLDGVMFKLKRNIEDRSIFLIS